MYLYQDTHPRIVQILASTKTVLSLEQINADKCNALTISLSFFKIRKMWMHREAQVQEYETPRSHLL